MPLRLIERITTWVEDGRIGDWLHPTHGPFPNFAAKYEDEDGAYISAVWIIGPRDEPRAWISIVEGPEEMHFVQLSYYWKILRRSPLLVSTRLSRSKVSDLRIPRGSKPMRIIAKRSVMLFKIH